MLIPLTSRYCLHCCCCRLEELNEKRGGMITKLKSVEKEREALEGKKLEAEAYITKQAERLKCQITGNKILTHKAEVSRAEETS